MTQPKPPLAETRCTCGRLLARLTDEGVELKCTRCRQVIVIAWSVVEDERSRPDDAR